MNNLTLFSCFQVHQLSESAEAPARSLGIAHLFARIVALGDAAPITILPDVPSGAGDAATPHAPSMHRGVPESDDMWSLWSYSHGTWSWLVIGGLTLDEVAEDLVQTLNNTQNKIEEIRICPPKTPLPCALACTLATEVVPGE